ncbi:MAG: M1 family metallopeptidase, partial [candidate division Zixibacteria bacterium]|nr:M1 family metallopeptidase [candidate division Zixibacteria bacterium]
MTIMPQTSIRRRSKLKALATFLLPFAFGAGMAASVSAEKYWQQQVDYIIDVTLAKDGRTITGSEIIIYTNNSPDTLHILYLKAFANSARKGSLMDLRNREHENYSIANSNRSQWGHARISNVRGRNNRDLKFELDDTIYKIFLLAPIAPGAIARVSLDFETKLPAGIGDRHEFVSGQSKAAYWYPQVCVYDRKVGWVNSPYLGRGECYGDFGDFEVSITAPEDRIVVATGLLGNRQEVLPDSLRSMLDISNFLGERASWPEFSFDTANTKTWKFFAKKVNDFAWVASADFCMDEGMSNGIKLEVYPRRSNAEGWVKAVEYAARSEETFSELYGSYGWPVIKVTDSYDGMEYPMITFCSGGDPSPRFPLLVYHEIGHFWFMGLVGTNQVDRACLDEGFTTMAEIVAMEKYHGRKGNNTNWSGHFYKDAFYKLDEDRDARGYRIYLEWVRSGYDLPMIVPSDNANEYWAYRNSSYYKPVVMHFTLRSIFGDETYFAAMKRYGTRWFFKHPYEDDFIETFSGYVDQDLDEYFAQWFSSRRKIDYAYEGKKRSSGDDFEITLSKPGDFVTPIDVAVIGSGADTSFYTINPEGHTFIKDGYHDAGTWQQYRQPSRKYTFTAHAPGGVKKVVVDPYNLLPDINRLNNSSGFL